MKGDAGPLVYVCQGCGTGQGYIWPMASDGDTRHAYVERCDSCERFNGDAAAFSYLVVRLLAEGRAFRAGAEIINGYPQPFIDPLEGV